MQWFSGHMYVRLYDQFPAVAIVIHNFEDSELGIFSLWNQLFGWIIVNDNGGCK